MEYKEIKKLMEDMGNSKLSEFEIEFPDGVKISMKKDSGIKISEQRNGINNDNETIIDGNNANENRNVDRKKTSTNDIDNINGQIVKSPMVGTVYLKSADNESNFVDIGSIVKKGDTLCIIESMKLMNEIVSEYDGKIFKILVKDKDMVDYNKPLFVIEQKGN